MNQSAKSPVTLPILYEDENLMVVNKRAGSVVNRAETVTAETVQDWAWQRSALSQALYDKEDDKARVFVSRAGVAHRLDKETSGCLLIAKDPLTLAFLLAQFKARQIKKEYVALAHGKITPKEGGWKLPIKRSSRERQQFTVKAGGKSAETHYEVDKYLYRSGAGGRGGEPFSLVKLQPITGRTHQLRVHLSQAKYPIVGDQTYGGRRAEADRKWCGRMFLHAQSISLRHPMSQKELTVRCPLPEELVAALAWLQHPV